MSRSSSPPPSEPAIAPRRRAWLIDRWPEMLGAAVALVFTAFILHVVPSPDVAWQLWIAHQLRMGARLYVDIVEINPPLWFWEAVPVDWAASLLRISSAVLLVAATGIAASASVWSTGRLLRHLPAPRRAVLLAYAALTLLLMPLVDTGQREQFVLIGALPYIVLAAARRQGRTVPPLFAATIGVAACFGFALKHYFLLAPILLEAWLLIARRRGYRPVRPETVALAAMGLLYAGAVVAIAPDFLTRMVPLARVAYATFAVAGHAGMVRPIQWYWLMALVPLLLHPRAVWRSAPTMAMLLAAAGFGLGWLIQFKGFPYHSIPASGCLMLALAFFVAENRPRLGVGARAATDALLVLPLAFTAWYGPFRDEFAPIVRPMLAGLAPHDGVAFISDEAVLAWPLSLGRDAPYPSRYYGMWIMHAVALDRGRTPALTRIGQEVVENTAQDYRCAQPARIIVSRQPVERLRLERRFLEDRSFADVMSHYRRVGSYRVFDIYQLRAHFPPPPASACRRSF
jgi:hypothetical protein